LDEITTDVLRGYKRFMEDQGYAGKTTHTRINIVNFLLKKNGIAARLPKDEMPVVDEEAAVPYSEEELKKLFAAMDKITTGTTAKRANAEIVKGKSYSGPGFGHAARYKFFLGTAARDKEVTYAAWSDIDFEKKTYHIRGKKDVGFSLKNHESRVVPIPDTLVELLKARKKNVPDPRWIFVNEDGKPDNHFLRKLKVIALHAGLNCGQCRTTITKGRYEKKREVAVTCETDPVCQHIYLHRFRKTCATRWEANSVPVRTIQHYLGHKNLETTMIYLGIADSASARMRENINRAFGV
jgi:integrase